MFGDEVKTRKAGEQVLGLVNHAYAEYVPCKLDELALMPAGLSFEQAAALPLVVLTGVQLVKKCPSEVRGSCVDHRSIRRSWANRGACGATAWRARNCRITVLPKERCGGSPGRPSCGSGWHC